MKSSRRGFLKSSGLIAAGAPLLVSAKNEKTFSQPDYTEIDKAFNRLVLKKDLFSSPLSSRNWSCSGSKTTFCAG